MDYNQIDFICNKMGVITYIFIALAFINAISCAPVDDSSVNPPALSLSSTTTPTYDHHFQDSKRERSASEESKESGESSEENKKRPARDSENSGVVAHQTKDLPQGALLTPPPVTKDAPLPQLPAREARDINEHVAAPAVVARQYGLSTSSTPAATTPAKS